MKQKVRTIYDSYNLYETYGEDAKETLKIQGMPNPDEDAIWSEIAEIDAKCWENVKHELERFFNDGSTWIIFGMTERWNGKFQSGHIFKDFMDTYLTATKSCDYSHIYDENGHLYLKCSHHDGTNCYEIKKLIDKGVDYLQRWEDNYDDTRNERYVHDRLVQVYSVLPNFVHNVYGLPKVENVKG